MAKERRRLLVPPARLGALAGSSLALNQLPLLESELHYLRRVLRLRQGDGFALVDGAGRLWHAALTAEGLAQLEQPLDAPLQQLDAPSWRLELVVAWPKRDGELLLRMACELGIDCITPVIAERSTAPELRSHERHQTILREAAEQCERLWLPQLGCQQRAVELFAAPRPGLRLLPTTRTEGLPLLAAALGHLANQDCQMGQEITVAVGPEGGWSPLEQECAISHGWQPVSLGPTILRTSTAAVAAAAQLSAWRAAL
ncbi:16S rRNA (uracil(1498)-N(3))-methyltransferase [Cyanobium sp. HWJ4-Hawea]|uniref:16S rRNA (uracil(1498)-N(3))-methyltransferase n=1 Tax=Cyanobium sp. HWJ4-Hawea TaxID=2823713 RepID=UPI0020CF6AA3|nr:16S rRNA (uracil(1498)-N(3))-methyltransferase [Cyanobium sp. HWJ4-Hawea]MCP9809951.1 16S rRNA (uracil(1498)-N(3))-methyltransferase [Cyanobium sp. HWJ4-Hawea]